MIVTVRTHSLAMKVNSWFVDLLLSQYTVNGLNSRESRYMTNSTECAKLETEPYYAQAIRGGIMHHHTSLARTPERNFKIYIF